MKRTVWVIPHTHYDAEVFMVEEQTLQIGYANVLGALRLLREEPAFRFALDQTCLIQPFLEAYPEARSLFREMVDANRLEIVGGMYVMPDVNIPCGESFIRQVLAGKTYCERELQVDVRCGWTIDSFGHHPQMPQLMIGCGFDHAAFQRLMKRGSPSEFHWRGIDGSQLFCHWMPRSYAVFYGAPHNVFEFESFVKARVKALAKHAVTSDLVAPAGADLTPVEPHLLEVIEAFNGKQNEVELVLATPSEALDAIKARDEFPTVTDDLNPVFQGCYSARIEIKQWNRRLENLLSNCEKYDAVAQRLGGNGEEARLQDAWRPVLFNQMHDIICGSHVDAVFANAMDRFRCARRIAAESLEASLEAISGRIDTTGADIPVVVFNSLSWERTDFVECGVAFTSLDVFEIAVRDSSGQAVPCDLLEAERHENGSLKRAKILFVATNVPPLGYEVYSVERADDATVATDLRTSHPYGGLLRFELDHGFLENAFYRVEFDLWNGAVTGLFDKNAGWEVLPGATRFANVVVKERDFGNFWQYNGPCKGDAFYPMVGRYPVPALNDNGADFSHLYHGDGVIQQGRAMAQFSISKPFGSGHFSTRVRLYAGVPRIDIQTSLVNNDERVRYRAAIPTGLLGGTITYEIPFGAIERPEGEFPAQNWVDYGDGNRGVTLLNRGLPGNNVVDGVMMLSLLKCTALKEGYAEVGGFRLGTPTEEGYEKGKKHVFDYGLVPHTGDWRHARAYRRGAEFNCPMIARKPRKTTGLLPCRLSFIEVSAQNVVVSAVRACADGMIVRVYEAEGRESRPFWVQTAWPLREALELNLVEKPSRTPPYDVRDGAFSLSLRPFEIRTIKLVYKTSC